MKLGQNQAQSPNKQLHKQILHPDRNEHTLAPSWVRAALHRDSPSEAVLVAPIQGDTTYLVPSSQVSVRIPLSTHYLWMLLGSKEIKALDVTVCLQLYFYLFSAKQLSCGNSCSKAKSCLCFPAYIISNNGSVFRDGKAKRALTALAFHCLCHTPHWEYPPPPLGLRRLLSAGFVTVLVEGVDLLLVTLVCSFLPWFPKGICSLCHYDTLGPQQQQGLSFELLWPQFSSCLFSSSI